MGPLFWARRSPTRAARLRQHCGDVSLVEEGHGACGPVHKSTFSDVRRATPDLATGAGVCAGVIVGVVVVVAVVVAALARWIGGAGGETAAPAAAALQQRQQSTVGAAHNGFPRLGEETAHAAESAVVPPPPSGSVDASIDGSIYRRASVHRVAPLHRCTATLWKRREASWPQWPAGDTALPRRGYEQTRAEDQPAHPFARPGRSHLPWPQLSTDMSV